MTWTSRTHTNSTLTRSSTSSTLSASTHEAAPESTSTSTGTVARVSSRSTALGTYKYRLYFKDLIGDRDHITLSLRVAMTEYDRLHLPVQERRLIHPYSDADARAATLRCVAIEEALADKMKCLLQRRYCFDLFDLVYGAFVTAEVEVDRSAILHAFLERPYSAEARLPRARCSWTFRSICSGDSGARCWSRLARMSFYDAVTRLREGIYFFLAFPDTEAETRLSTPPKYATWSLRPARTAS